MKRSIEEMIACRKAPRAPDGKRRGVRMAELAERACRFPIREVAGGIHFCAAPVEPERWTAGGQHSRYCAFHREFLLQCESVVEEDA